MPRDPDFDRLEAERHQALRLERDTGTALKNAEDSLSAAHLTHAKALAASERARQEEERTLHRYREVRRINPRHIRALEAKKKHALASRKQARAEALAIEYRRIDTGGLAARYRAEGDRYKEQAQACDDERLRLVNEIRYAREAHEAAVTKCVCAERDVVAAKQAVALAETNYQRAVAAHAEAEAKVQAAQLASHTWRQQLEAAALQRREEDRLIALQAGVPARYLDNIQVVHKDDGTTHIYFGGIGNPGGPYHGHYVLNADGVLEYARLPYAAGGGHNYVDTPEPRSV